LQIAEQAPEEMTDEYTRVGNVCITSGDSSTEWRVRPHGGSSGGTPGQEPPPSV
jgi:hypothetical protein